MNHIKSLTGMMSLKEAVRTMNQKHVLQGPAKEPPKTSILRKEIKSSNVVHAHILEAR